MKTKALSESEYDDYGTFNYFLKQDGLTQPPHWASDLRCATPREQRFRYPPVSKSEEWIDSIDAHDFDLELGLTSDDSNLVIDSYHSIRTNKYHVGIRISSALVSPETGPSLVRALQTSDDSHDYRIPPVGNDLEIDEEGYKLLGWINEYSSDSLLDQKDTFNHGISKIESLPSENVMEVLGLRQSDSYPVSWINNKDEKAFFYEAWADSRGDLNNEEYIFGEEVISDGHRLKVSSKSLASYLKKVGFDLVVEVELTRRISKDGIIQYDQESKKESRYSRIYLFRRTGEILTTEGCVATWASHSY